MSESSKKGPTRRDFLKNTGYIAAASVLATKPSRSFYSQENPTIQIALVGCGGRGTGAASNALSVRNGPIKLVAMADVFEQRLTDSYAGLWDLHADQMDIPQERQFLGFHAYQQAMDCLNPGDVVILATPPAFRWVHFTYAIEKGLNVFMEKPVTVDGPTTLKMLDLARVSANRNIKVGVGLMVRHCRGRLELKRRIDQGEIGDIICMRAYRMWDWEGIDANTANLNELMYQIKMFHGFIWASGGCFNDFYIHQIDECSWMKGAWPIQAQATGGRHYRYEPVDQNFDNYSVEYTYPDGTKLFLYGRNMAGCYGSFSSIAHGTKGAAIISSSGHTPGKVRTFRGHNLDESNIIWQFPQPEPDPYQLEWDDLIDAIREDKPYNETERGTIASLVSSMGRMAAHTGQLITYDQMLHCEHELAPEVDRLTMESPAPVLPDANGVYPMPQPGITFQREYKS